MGYRIFTDPVTKQKGKVREEDILKAKEKGLVELYRMVNEKGEEGLVSERDSMKALGKGFKFADERMQQVVSESGKPVSPSRGGEALIAGAQEAATLGHIENIKAAGSVTPEDIAQGNAQNKFTQSREKEVASQEQLRQERPGAFATGEALTGLAMGAGGGPSTVKGAIKTAGTMGGIVGASEAESLSDIPREVVKGAALGAGLASGLGALGKTLKLATKAGRAEAHQSWEQLKTSTAAGLTDSDQFRKLAGPEGASVREVLADQGTPEAIRALKQEAVAKKKTVEKLITEQKFDEARQAVEELDTVSKGLKSSYSSLEEQAVSELRGQPISGKPDFLKNMDDILGNISNDTVRKDFRTTLEGITLETSSGNLDQADLLLNLVNLRRAVGMKANFKSDTPTPDQKHLRRLYKEINNVIDNSGIDVEGMQALRQADKRYALAFNIDQFRAKYGTKELAPGEDSLRKVIQVSGSKLSKGGERPEQILESLEARSQTPLTLNKQTVGGPIAPEATETLGQASEKVKTARELKSELDMLGEMQPSKTARAIGGATGAIAGSTVPIPGIGMLGAVGGAVGGATRLTDKVISKLEPTIMLAKLGQAERAAEIARKQYGKDPQLLQEILEMINSVASRNPIIIPNGE